MKERRMRNFAAIMLWPYRSFSICHHKSSRGRMDKSGYFDFLCTRMSMFFLDVTENKFHNCEPFALMNHNSIQASNARINRTLFRLLLSFAEAALLWRCLQVIQFSKSLELKKLNHFFPSIYSINKIPNKIQTSIFVLYTKQSQLFC